MPALSDAVRDLWQSCQPCYEKAHQVLSELSQEGWLQFAILDVAATLGLRAVKFSLLLPDSARLTSRTDVLEQTLSLMLTRGTPETLPRLNAVSYGEFGRTVFVTSSGVSFSSLQREAAKIMMGMLTIAYHADSIVLLPSELRQRELDVLAESLHFSREHLYCLFALVSESLTTC